MQEKAQDSQGNDLDSGTNLRESFANWSPDSSSWRTSQRCLLEGWTPYSAPWPRSGTTLNGRAFELPTWVQGIDASGCSSLRGELRRMVDSWATPSASDGLAETLSPGMGARERGPQNLMECVAKITWPNWPTAQAHDGMGMPGAGTRARGGRRSDLNVAVANWPTPDATASNDGEDLESWLARRDRVRATGINGNGMETPLAVAARLWPTATTGDANGSGSAGYSTESGRSEGTTLTDAAVRGIRAGAPQSKSIKGLKLNPAWVEQLMGFPPGWTLLGPASPKPTGKRPASSRTRKTAPCASKPSETPSSRKSRKSSGDGC